MRVCRLNYDKAHRCPTWSGPAWKAGSHEGCNGSFASFMYERRAWAWRFTRCPQCRVLCLPYVTRRLDWTWWQWRASRRVDEWKYQREWHGKWPYNK